MTPNIKIVSGGTPETTHLIWIPTGELIGGITDVTWNISTAEGQSHALVSCWGLAVELVGSLDYCEEVDGDPDETTFPVHRYENVIDIRGLLEQRRR